MNTYKVARELSLLTPFIKSDDPITGKEHIEEMIQKILLGEIYGEKAHRWIGWIQASMCMHGATTLEECKKINKRL